MSGRESDVIVERVVALTEQLLDALRKERNDRANMKRVLIVEDDPNDACLNKLPLSGMGFDVDIATTEEEALEMINRSTDTYDSSYMIVFVDLKLGTGDGISVIRRIKTITPYLPVVVITGMEIRSDLVCRATELGYVGFIKKPLVKAETIEIMLKHRIPIPIPLKEMACA